MLLVLSLEVLKEYIVIIPLVLLIKNTKETDNDYCLFFSQCCKNKHKRLKSYPGFVEPLRSRPHSYD